MAGRSLFNGCDGGGSTTAARDSIFMSGSSSSSFLGLGSMLSFQDNKGVKRSERPFFQSYDQEENDEEDLDEYFRQPEKKRRLTSDQVEFLEKSFELENKLEPERKIELAKELGLQPRQVAIWFQNRRARWKTKQLEKDYETMLASYDTLKADYDDLLKEKDKLKDEIASINKKLLDKEKGFGTLKSSNADNIIFTTTPPPKEPNADYNVLKQDELSSTKSYVFDSDSPRGGGGGGGGGGGVHSSSPLEPGDHSSYVLEHDQSDLSQDEEDINISKNLLVSHHDYFYTKMEDARYSGLTNSTYLGFPTAADDQAFNFW